MTPEELAEIKARADAAPPGPWRVEVHEPSLSRVIRSEDHTLDIDLGYVGNRTEREAAFIVHARADVPALLDEVARLTAADDRVRALHKGHISGTCEFCWLAYPCPTILVLDGGEPA